MIAWWATLKGEYVGLGGLVAAIFLGIFVWAVTYRRYEVTSYGYTVYSTNPSFQGLMLIGVLVGIAIFLYGLFAEKPEAASQLRPPSASDKCWKCGTEIENDWMICPICKTQFRWKCPRCDRLLPSGYRVCPYCGYEFMTEIVEPVTKLKVIGKCPQCGTLIGEGLSYCKHCGWKVSHEELKHENAINQ